MEITIKNQEVALKNSFRAMIIYENIMDKTFNPVGITEIIVYFYSVVLASKKDIELTYDEFVDWLDEYPEELNNFSMWFRGLTEQENHIKKNFTEKEEEKK